GFHVCNVFYGSRRVNDESCAFCLNFFILFPLNSKYTSILNNTFSILVYFYTNLLLQLFSLQVNSTLVYL
ncbi:initiation control protein YabA, partial [Desemzia incerta]|uniref:initiation control protein YabA n=1 Tax=Desemzia incerta TaxID=82801 RepID=UPI003CFDF7EA